MEYDFNIWTFQSCLGVLGSMSRVCSVCCAVTMWPVATTQNIKIQRF